MDDKTIRWMKARLKEAEYLQQRLSDLQYKRRLATNQTTTVCARNDALNYYSAGLPFPDEARAFVVAAIDAQIEELENKLAEM